ncbi:hypothetical protein OsI_12329 [Oryza sativa Indica Group]|uniref:Uncharacterized protein n=1 Tax=Oryza sativa subsp. indica TaxID=39946 RepID=B8AL41_ORYSI|nr:hypothetical protein OsI_12329 [Oryza sativa Indica Group]
MQQELSLLPQDMQALWFLHQLLARASVGSWCTRSVHARACVHRIRSRKMLTQYVKSLATRQVAHDRNLGLLDGFPRLAAIWAEKKCKPQIMSLAQAVNEIARESLMLHWGFMSVCARLCGDLTFWCFADLSSLDLPVMEGLDKLLLAMAKGVNPEENGVMVASSTNGGIASQRQPIALRTPAPELSLQLPDEQQ